MYGGDSCLRSDRGGAELSWRKSEAGTTASRSKWYSREGSAFRVCLLWDGDLFFLLICQTQRRDGGAWLRLCPSSRRSGCLWFRIERKEARVKV